MLTTLELPKDFKVNERAIKSKNINNLNKTTQPKVKQNEALKKKIFSLEKWIKKYSGSKTATKKPAGNPLRKFMPPVLPPALSS